MLHYNPRRVSRSTTLIFRRSYCIIAASGIVTLCKWPYSTDVDFIHQLQNIARLPQTIYSNGMSRLRVMFRCAVERSPFSVCC